MVWSVTDWFPGTWGAQVHLLIEHAGGGNLSIVSSSRTHSWSARSGFESGAILVGLERGQAEYVPDASIASIDSAAGSSHSAGR